MRKKPLFITVVAILLFSVGSTIAEKFSAKGKTFYVRVNEDDRQLPDGRIVRTTVDTGHLVFADGSPGRSETCYTTVIHQPGQAKGKGGGHCRTVDVDGDSTWIWLKLNPVGNQWGYIQGTGKFEGITGLGTSKPGKAWPNGNFVVEWEIEYEIP